MNRIPAVAYCRVSRDTEDQENSFEAQQQFFLTQAEKLGFQLIKDYGKNGIYADEGISGKSRTKRDQFNQMILDAQKGDFQFILTTNLKRYARDVVTLQETVRELRKYKVYIYFIKENIKTNDFTEEVLMNILAALAQNDLVDMSKAIQHGMRQAQREGKYTSQPPFGYDRIKGFLVINEKESVIVKDIFDMYVNKKMPLNKIAQYLNSNNIQTKRKSTKKSSTSKTNNKSKWDSSTVKYMLKNVIYTGLQINHKTECVDIFNNIKEKMDIDEWIQHRKEELRIVDNDIFEAAQEELKYRASLYVQGKRYSTVNILSNLFYCQCGSTMKRFERTGNHTSFYMCRNHHNRKLCPYSNYTREDKILEYIINEIKNFEFSWQASGAPANIKELYEIYINDNLSDNIIDNLPEVESKIAKLEKRKKNFSIQYADGDISKDEFKSLVEDVRIELEVLLKEKKKIQNLHLEKERVWNTYEQFVKTIKKFDENNFDNNELRKIIKKITVITNNENEKNYVITWNNGLDKNFETIEEEFAENRLVEIHSLEDFYETYEFDR